MQETSTNRYAGTWPSGTKGLIVSLDTIFFLCFNHKTIIYCM